MDKGRPKYSSFLTKGAGPYLIFEDFNAVGSRSLETHEF